MLSIGSALLKVVIKYAVFKFLRWALPKRFHGVVNWIERIIDWFMMAQGIVALLGAIQTMVVWAWASIAAAGGLAAVVGAAGAAVAAVIGSISFPVLVVITLFLVALLVYVFLRLLQRLRKPMEAAKRAKSPEEAYGTTKRRPLTAQQRAAIMQAWGFTARRGEAAA